MGLFALKKHLVPFMVIRVISNRMVQFLALISCFSGTNELCYNKGNNKPKKKKTTLDEIRD